MPLHERETVRQQLDDCVFVGRDLTAPVPKYRFPQDETPPKQAFQVVSDELMTATPARTWPRSARRG
jgi:glutamate decarboxylase